MTAILISRDITEESDTIYLAADGRVTAGDTIISEHNKKIFTYKANDKHEFTRHYITVGDVNPTDYLIHKLEAISSFEDLYMFMFENDILNKMPGYVVFYVIDDIPGNPRILQIYKNKKTSGVTTVDLNELTESPIFDGSGGEAVLSSFLTAGLIDGLNHRQRIALSFKIASEIVITMNSNVDIIPIQLKRFRKKKQRGNVNE